MRLFEFSLPTQVYSLSARSGTEFSTTGGVRMERKMRSENFRAMTVCGLGISAYARAREGITGCLVTPVPESRMGMKSVGFR